MSFSVVTCAFWRMSVSPHMSLTDLAQVADLICGSEMTVLGCCKCPRCDRLQKVGQIRTSGRV